MQGINARIILPGPAMPRTSADTRLSRVAFPVGDFADFFVCGSSRTTRSGRIDSPLGWVKRVPRIPSPVRPVAPRTAPDVGTFPSGRSGQSAGQFAGGRTTGNTTFMLPHSISVGSPWQSCPAHRLATPLTWRTAWLISGKSAANSGKKRM